MQILKSTKFTLIFAAVYALGLLNATSSMAAGDPPQGAIELGTIARTSADRSLAAVPAAGQAAGSPDLPRADAPSAFHAPLPPAVREPALLNPLSLDQTYTLGAGDLVQINFFNVPEYSGQQIILVDGSLNFPALGRVSVVGMTLAEAEAAIATQYSSELRHPQVTMTLLRPRPLQVGIVGEVSQPGLYALALTQDSQLPTVAQIIQTAGGTTQAADLRQIEIRRPRRSGLPQTITVNLWEFLQNGDLSQNLALRDGDTIVIPATAGVNLAETAQLAASNLAASSQTLDVALVGEVFRPGAYKLTTETDTGGRTLVSGRPTLTRAIQIAGGVTPSADLRQVQVRRTTRAGSEQVIDVNLWQLVQSGDLSQDVVLQEGDTVMIPTATTLTSEESVQLASANLSPNAIRVNVVGEVVSPGATEVPSGTTLNQAVLAAGGLNRRANRTVELIRLNPNGTVLRQTIHIDLSQSINPETNPILRNSDAIVVHRTGLAAVTDSLGDIGGGLINSTFSILRFLPGF